MQVIEIIPPARFNARGEKLGMPLTIPAGSKPAFVIQLMPEQLEELERQLSILKWSRAKTLEAVLMYGFHSMEHIGNLLRMTHGD